MQFPCSDDGLRKRGRAQPGKQPLPDEAALKEGAAQFKVELSEVRAPFEKDAWVRANVLVAVAAGEDGLAGIARDSGFRAHREELGRMADIVFSSSPGDRTYWLGEHHDFRRIGRLLSPVFTGRTLMWWPACSSLTRIAGAGPEALLESPAKHSRPGPAARRARGPSRPG